MKSLLLFFYYVVYANAQLKDLISGKAVHLGPYDAMVQIGNLSQRYTPLSGDDLISSRNARNLVEEARRMFRVGFYTLPPLDPYTRSSLPPLSIDNDFDLLRGRVLLNNLEMTGAIRFKLNLLELRLGTERVDFGFTIPLLNLNVDLQADLVLAELLPLHMKGHLSVVLKGVNILGAVRAKPIELSYQLVALHSRLHIDDVVLQFKGKEIDLNQIIQDATLGSANDDLMPDLFARLFHHINTYVANIVLQESNKILAGASTKQVLAYLLPEQVS
ncbi:unnamed protein product, partial [Iphiclides podalirius]